MTWNYRVVEVTIDPYPPSYGIYEVYYDEEDNPVARTLDAVPFAADSVEELRSVLLDALVATKQPVLTDENFPFGEKKQ